MIETGDLFDIVVILILFTLRSRDRALTKRIESLEESAEVCLKHTISLSTKITYVTQSIQTLTEALNEQFNQEK